MNIPALDELCQSILNILPSLGHSQTKLKQQIKDLITQQLLKLDLVTREEFEVQSKVLQRTRQKLEQLEAKVKELE